MEISGVNLENVIKKRKMKSRGYLQIFLEKCEKIENFRFTFKNYEKNMKNENFGGIGKKEKNWRPICKINIRRSKRKKEKREKQAEGFVVKGVIG